jgi:hypothetical protein
VYAHQLQCQFDKERDQERGQWIVGFTARSAGNPQGTQRKIALRT